MVVADADPKPYVDAQGTHWSSYHAAIFAGKLGLCGCADGDLEADILAVLTRLYDAHEAGESVYYHAFLPKDPRVYVELILHLLDNAGFTEHGTSVRGSWISDEGEEVVRRLRAEADARAEAD